MALSKDDIVAQSRSAYNQWCTQWREHSKKHAQFEQKNLTDFLGIGSGKACLLIANGASFERNINIIKKYQDNVDILVCDKSLGHCLANGIKPTYCIVCDANVNYDKYLEPYKDQVKDTILFANVCANPEWTHKAQWKDVYFFVNEDVLESEKEFMTLSGCPNKIPAATNVSNAMIVFLTQSSNQGQNNFFGYDKYCLIGYDFCFKADPERGSYYAFDYDAQGKRNYMRHVYCVDVSGDHCYTSTNLLFSAKWLKDYLSVFNLPVVNCSRDTIFVARYFGKLEEQLKYRAKQDGAKLNAALKERIEIIKRLKSLDTNIHLISKEHRMAFLQTV